MRQASFDTSSLDRPELTRAIEGVSSSGKYTVFLYMELMLRAKHARVHPLFRGYE